MALSNYDPGQELSSIDFSAVIGGPLTAVVEAQSRAAIATVDFIKSVGFTPDVEDETTGEITPGQPVYVSFKYPKLVQPYQPGINGQLTAVTVNNGGTGYTQGDVLNIAPAEGASFTITVTGESSGVITSVAFDSSLSGYDSSGETNLSANGGSGSNATFDISAQDVDPQAAVYQEMQLEVPLLTMVPIPFVRMDRGKLEFNAKITSMEYKRVGSDFKLGRNMSFGNTNTNQNLAALPASLNYNKNVSTVNLKTNISYQRTSKSGHKIEKTYHLGMEVEFESDEITQGVETILGILEDAIVSRPVE